MFHHLSHPADTRWSSAKKRTGVPFCRPAAGSAADCPGGAGHHRADRTSTEPAEALPPGRAQGPAPRPPACGGHRYWRGRAAAFRAGGRAGSHLRTPDPELNETGLGPGVRVLLHPDGQFNVGSSGPRVLLAVAGIGQCPPDEDDIRLTVSTKRRMADSSAAARDPRGKVKSSARPCHWCSTREPTKPEEPEIKIFMLSAPKTVPEQAPRHSRRRTPETD